MDDTHLLKEILASFPDELLNFEEDCRERGILGSTAIVQLLGENVFTHRSNDVWRNAVFRFLDYILSTFHLDNSAETRPSTRLKVEPLPFASYYVPIMIKQIASSAKCRDMGKRLDKIQRDDPERVGWSEAKRLSRYSRVAGNVEAVCQEISDLFNDKEETNWAKFALCVKIADRYDMFRKLYQSLNQPSCMKEIRSSLSEEERGNVLDLWQSAVDARAGAHCELKKELITVVHETHTLPDSLVLLKPTFMQSKRKATNSYGYNQVATVNDAHIAYKFFDVNEARKVAAFQDCCREAIVWRQLKHDNIAAFLGLYFDETQSTLSLALVSQWMGKRDLPGFLYNNPEIDGISFVAQVARGMQYLHSQDPPVIHGNLCATNVLVDDNGLAVITNVGISRIGILSSAEAPQSTVKRFLRWQAPELSKFKGHVHTTIEGDVYAFAMTSFEIIARKIPFPELRQDTQVLAAITDGQCKQKRPTTFTPDRAAITQLWPMLDRCWDVEIEKRPSMNEVLVVTEEASYEKVQEDQQKEIRSDVEILASDMSMTHAQSIYYNESAEPLPLGALDYPFARDSGFPSKRSANRWVPMSISHQQIDRKVRSLVNKLTMGNFESVSNQIIAWANKSENEKDGRTFIRVTRLVYEKAIDEEIQSEVYARLCRKMMEQVSPNVQDDGIRNSEGKPITGGLLFRKYLLNLCQEHFERSWSAKEATAAASAAKASEDKAIAEQNDKRDKKEEEEAALNSEEYYASQKAKRQGLGLVKFIGELFKLQMLTERIMHECIKKLLSNVDNPEEEEIESLCKLLTTVGQALDTQKARGHMDVYFKRMKERADSSNVSSRMKYMLQDIIELRERRWIPRNAAAAPSTLAQVHETEKAQAVKYRAASGENGGNATKFSLREQRPKMCRNKDALNRSVNISRGGAPQQPKLNLLSRSKHVSEKPETTLEGEAESSSASMSKVQAQKKIDQDVKEFFAIRNFEEAEVYFSTLPIEHRHMLVDKLVVTAVESKEVDAKLVADFFDRSVSKNLCSPNSFEEGFTPTAEIIDDIAIDAPKAFQLFAIMLKGAKLDDERQQRVADKSMDSEKLLKLLA